MARAHWHGASETCALRHVLRSMILRKKWMMLNDPQYGGDTEVDTAVAPVDNLEPSPQRPS